MSEKAEEKSMEKAERQANVSWKCNTVSPTQVVKLGYAGIILGLLFGFFILFLLCATYLSVIGVQNPDLVAQWILYWNPITDPFVWVIIVVFGLSLTLILIAIGVRYTCKVR